MAKHHYRDISEAKYLHNQDLGNAEWVLTTKEGKREEIEDPKTKETKPCNVVYFVEDEKPWIANAMACGDVLSKLSGSPFVEDWGGLTIKLYRDTKVRGKGGDMVSAIRVRDEVIPPKEKLTKKHKDWDIVSKSMSTGNVEIRRILNKYFVSDALRAELESMADGE